MTTTGDAHKVVLIITTLDQSDYLERLGKLNSFIGWIPKVYKGLGIKTITDVSLLAHSVGARAVICISAPVLQVILEGQIDYRKPSGRKQITLDDYQGSILDLYPIRTKELDIPGKEVLVLNPPEHLVTVPYAEFIFNRFISKITKPAKWFPQTKFTWRRYDPAEDDLDPVYTRFARADFIAVDIETQIGDASRSINCVGYCAYFRDSHTTECIVIPFNSELSWIWVKKFNDLPQAKIFQNGQYDNAYFARWNCLPHNWLWDTKSLFHSWYSELPKRLDFVAAFSIRKVRYWKDDGSTGSLEDYYRYNALDCWATANAFLSLMSEMPDWAMKNYLLKFPKLFPCFHCALEGLAWDSELAKEVKKEKETTTARDLARLQYLIAEPNFNPGSWQQTAKLFRILGLVLPDTGKASMLKAKASSQFNENILTYVTNYREAVKLVGNYFNEDAIWNGRLLYSLDPDGTDTLRFASKESYYWCGFQIQNIPRGDTVKKCVVADPGWLLFEIDKAQSEARCVGYLSGETKLIDLVESDKDYHSFNASAFFGIPYEKIYNQETKKTVDKELRDLSKRTNHGANYNMGAGVMLDTMGPKKVAAAKITLRLPTYMRLKDVCAHLLAAYERTYPKVKGTWYQSIVSRIAVSKKLVSAFGWTRYFFGNPSKNKRDLNSAVAHEPQNLSVSIINEEFYKLWRATVYGELRGRVRLKAQIHDSILGQYRVEEPTLPQYIRDTYMNTKVAITDPEGVTRTMFIPSDISCGKVRWGELK